MSEEHKSIRPETLLAWTVCLLAAIFYCYEFFLRVAPSVMVQDMMGAYGVSASGFALMSAAYYYIYTPMQLPVGVLMDKFGPRRLLTLAVFLCAIGAILISTVMTLSVGTIARALMGFGSAFAFVGVLKLAAHWLPPSRLALVSGLATTLGMLGAIGGDTVLSHLVEVTGWRMSWVIAGILGLILTLLVWMVVRDNPQHKHGKRYMERDARTWKQAGIYLLTNAKSFQFWVNGIVGGLLFMPLSVFGDLWGVSFLKEGYGMSASLAGSAVSMLFLGMAIGGPIMGWLSDQIGRRRVLLMGGAFFAAIWMILLLYVPNLSTFMIFVLLLLIGISVGAEVLVFAIGCEISSPKAAGTAVAGTNFLVMLGGMIFQPVAGIVLDHVWSGQLLNGLRFYNFSDYQIALSVLPVGLVLAVILLFFMKETYCKQQNVDIHHRGSAKGK